jgi:hypothetical protein
VTDAPAVGEVTVTVGATVSVDMVAGVRAGSRVIGCAP